MTNNLKGIDLDIKKGTIIGIADPADLVKARSLMVLSMQFPRTNGEKYQIYLRPTSRTIDWTATRM